MTELPDGIVAKGYACIDCALLIENDDTTHLDEREAIALRARVAQRTNEIAPVIDPDDHVDFSSIPCLTCADQAGGVRFRVILFEEVAR